MSNKTVFEAVIKEQVIQALKDAGIIWANSDECNPPGDQERLLGRYADAAIALLCNEPDDDDRMVVIGGKAVIWTRGGLIVAESGTEADILRGTELFGQKR